MESVIHIKYSKKQLRYGLIFSIIWIAIFIFYAIFRPESYFGYGYLVMAFFFFGLYMFKKFRHYATIKKGVLTKQQLIPKRMKLDEITDVLYFAGKYKLKTDHSEMSINTMEIDPQSVKDLKRILDNINTKP